MTPALDSPLYLITDGGVSRSEGKLISRVEGALRNARGLIGFVQLREQGPPDGTFPAASDREILKLLRELKALCHEHGARLTLSRRADLALLAEIDGVHLGARSYSLSEVRELVGEKLLLGYSAHSTEEAERAFCEGAHYVFLSPVYSPLSKPETSAPLGPRALRGIRRTEHQQLYALGGITFENIFPCLDNGADGCAMISSLLSPEPQQIEALQSALKERAALVEG